MTWTDDPIADYGRYSDKLDRELDLLPRCAYCMEPIQDNYCYCIDGDTIHLDCIIDYLEKDYKVSTDNFIE